MTTSPSYIPAPALCRGSVLTASQLVADFQDFCANLGDTSCTPAFVFERLVSSLNQVFTAALERERLQHAITFERERLQHVAALEKSHEENKVLQLLNQELKKELTELRQGNTSGPVVQPGMPEYPIIGTFDTEEVKPNGLPGAVKISRKVSFASPYSAPPGLIVGFNMLDIANENNIRVKSYASNIQEDSFNIGVESWGDTKLSRAGCTWLEVAPNDPDFQFGTFNTKESLPEGNGQFTWRSVTFPQAYRAPPQVVAWLTSMDFCRTKNWRVKAYADRVTTTGFVIHIDTYYDTKIFYARASWVAYPVDKPNIYSGRFSTLDFRPLGCPQPYNSAYENFGTNVFTAPPRVLLAIDSFDIGCGQNMRLGVRASSVSAAGMTWHADSWKDTKLYCAGASYIALG